MKKGFWDLPGNTLFLRILVLLAVYYVGSTLPVPWVSKRVIVFRIVGQPLTGYWWLDLTIFLVSALPLILALSRKTGRKWAALGLLASSSVSLSIILRYKLLYPFGVVAFASVALILYSLYRARIIDRRDLADSFADIVLVFSIAVIACVGSYFVLGYWATPAKFFVERFLVLWAPLAWVIPVMLVALGTSWLYRMLRGKNVVAVFPLKQVYAKTSRERENMNINPLIGLMVGLLLAWLAVILPHMPTVNKGFLPVSVDTFFYTKFLWYADKHGLEEALRRFHGMARPLYLIVLYKVYRTIGDPFILMDLLHPLLAYSLLVLSSYFVASRICGKECAGLAAILAGSSHIIATFTHSGLQANSIALPLALLYFVLSKPLLITVMIFVALIHPWTHVMYSVSFVLYTFRKKGIREAPMVGGIAVIAMAIAEATSRILVASSVVEPTSRPLLIYEPLRGLYYGLYLVSWSSALNPPIYVTALMGAMPLTAASILASYSPLLLFVNRYAVHRLLVNTPFELASAKTLSGLWKRAGLAFLLSSIAYYFILLSYAYPLTMEHWWEIIGVEPFAVWRRAGMP